MDTWLFVLVGVTVAGLVGGVTNHLAIKMLFHPRRPWVVFGYRIPFTPGLIPKRKQEIAVSLGDVVAEYLVTADALRELFGKEEFRASAISRIGGWVRRELGEGATAGDCIRRWAGEEKAGDWLSVLPHRAGEWAGQAFASWWERGGLGAKRIREAVPGWSESAAASWADRIAGWGLGVIKNELLSAEGQALLRKLAAQLMDRQGGFIGMLAGIFVDEDKLVARLTPFLAEQLDSPKVRSQVSGLLGKRILKLGEMTLEEALRKLSKEEPPEQWVQRWMEERLPWAEWTGKLEHFPVGQWLADREETWQRWLSAAVDGALAAIGRQAHRIVAALRLPEMVRTQVERFPVERLEQVILSVSGREFKAITWLGVLLGGMIGLLQSILVRMWPGG